MSQANRVETMAEKVAIYARRAGVDDVALLMSAYQMAMRPRIEHLSDVFHHDMLHPARTVLTLIEQAGMTKSTVLAAAALTETWDQELVVPTRVLRADITDFVTELRDAVPTPLGGTRDTLLEALVTAETEAALIAVAERLDHARHLHFRKQADWRPFYEEAVAVYLPVAERVNSGLAHRFERWAWAFGKRLS